MHSALSPYWSIYVVNVRSIGIVIVMLDTNHVVTNVFFRFIELTMIVFKIMLPNIYAINIMAVIEDLGIYEKS